MGLDMYLSKFKKIDAKKAKWFEGEFEKRINDFGYEVWDVVDGNEEEIEEIKDFLVRTKVYRTVWDYERFEKENNLKGWYLWNISHEDIDKVTLCYRNDGKTREFSLTKTEYNSYYQYKLCDCYIVSCEEVDYWRKNYDLQDLIHEGHDNAIHNCGYALLTNEEVEAIERECGKSYPWLNDDEAYVYMEWY